MEINTQYIYVITQKERVGLIIERSIEERVKQIGKRKLECIGHMIKDTSGKELAELIKIRATQRNN